MNDTYEFKFYYIIYYILFIKEIYYILKIAFVAI